VRNIDNTSTFRNKAIWFRLSASNQAILFVFCLTKDQKWFVKTENPFKSLPREVTVSIPSKIVITKKRTFKFEYVQLNIGKHTDFSKTIRKVNEI
jgi:hypothetical protein